MKTLLSRILLAMAMTGALFLMVPGQAAAAPWCDICYDTNDCLACCRCDGGTFAQCLRECGYYPAAPSDETTLVSFSTCEPLMSVATPAEDTVEAEPTDAQPVEPTAAG